MICNKCKGRVFVDRTFSEKRHVELFCLMCGKRWMLDKERTQLGRWLNSLENLRDLAKNVSAGPIYTSI